ncbi:MAG TPA: DNA alkylation repair protein [Firmicutes bacterium]|jgi:hypothetical protein|nr:DNA alkylation repair protein [Bacillota bacterium]
MTYTEVMQALEALGREQTKQIYIRHGAREPLFGVLTGDMKPLAKRIGKNHDLAMRLYAGGNYDAMYFAGMIAEPDKMTETDLDDWVDKAYCYALADYVVGTTLAETGFAQPVADRWIKSGREFVMAAGWTCYCELLVKLRNSNSVRDEQKIKRMLNRVVETIHQQPDRTRYSMNNFVIAVGSYYLPLRNEALAAARTIGKVHVNMGETACKVPQATQVIQKVIAREQQKARKQA